MIIEFTGKDLRAMPKKDIDKKLKDGFKKAIKQSKKDQKERLKKCGNK